MLFLSESVIFKLGQFRTDFGLGGAELEAPVVDALNVLLVLNVERRVDDGLFARGNDVVEAHHILQLAERAHRLQVRLREHDHHMGILHADGGGRSRSLR